MQDSYDWKKMSELLTAGCGLSRIAALDEFMGGVKKSFFGIADKLYE